MHRGTPNGYSCARRPAGLPVNDDFRLVETLMPSPGASQMLTRTIYLSLDPYQWGRRRGGLEAVLITPHGDRKPDPSPPSSGSAKEFEDAPA